MYEKLRMGIQTRLEMIIAILLKNFFKLTSSLTQLHQAIPALTLLKQMLSNMKFVFIQQRDGYGKRD